VLAGYVHTLDRGVDDDVRRVRVVPHPFVHGSNQVGTF
jgi:hypothetical protein